MERKLTRFSFDNGSICSIILSMTDKDAFDFIVIGGGVVGSAIARELARYDARIAVIEKNPDVVDETSGRNSGVIHGGFAYDTGSLKARFCVEGNRMMDSLASELSVPFRRTGKVLVGNTEEDRKSLERTMEQGAANGASGLRMIDGRELHEIVPAVLGSFALLSSSSGIIDPFLLTIHLAENAAANGVRYYLSHKVMSIRKEKDGHIVDTDKSSFRTRWVINSAGLGAKDVSEMLGFSSYRVIGSKGNYLVLDKTMGALLPLPVYPVPSNTYMGIHVTPTIDGNVTVGPDASPTMDLSYYGVPQEKIELLENSAGDLWPHIHRKNLIRTFSGILPKLVDENGAIQDFRIEIDDRIDSRAVNLIGIESPGLTSCVPIARHVVSLIAERETLRDSSSFNPCHPRPIRFRELSEEEKDDLIRKDPAWGRIVCSCEMVSEREILDAIANPLGVRTITGIKYRTRSMMGLCQSGFCQMRIEQLLERSGLDADEVEYMYPGSWVVKGKVRA